MVGAGAAIALLVNINSTTIFTALSSICIAMLYLAYLGVTLPLLVVRIRHRNTDRFPAGVDEDGKPLFSMGRFGLAVNVVAVIYQVIMVVNLMWPRTEIYDLSPHGNWVLQYSALLLVAAVVAVGAGYFGYKRLHQQIELVHVPHTHVPASRGMSACTERQPAQARTASQARARRACQGGPHERRAEHRTDSVLNARDDARAQAGQTSEWMPYLPAVEQPVRPGRGRPGRADLGRDRRAGRVHAQGARPGHPAAARRPDRRGAARTCSSTTRSNRSSG